MSKNKKIEAIYQLSPLQRGILFHTAYAPESGMYFEQVLLVIEGDLDTAMLERAWQETANRQDVLRTLFVWEGQDKPHQVVVEQVKLPFEQHDWRELSSPEQRERLETFLAEDRRRGFDLTKPPLMRLFLIRVEDQRYQLVLSFHHLLLDGWSMWLLLGEVFSCYEAACKNEPFKLEKLLSYGDYIGWLQKQDLSAAEEYWRQTLAGFTTPTRLRVERGFPASAGFDYLEEELHLAEETTTSLLSFARKNKLTLSTLVQGAWALMLSRWSGAQDVVYGVVVSGRPASLPGAESIVGLFINSLPMRAQLSWDESAVSWLRSLQDQMAEMSQYEYSPLVDIQGWTEVPRGVQLFDTLFAFENYPMEAHSLGEVAGLKVQFTRAVEKTNYSINVVAVPGARLMLKIIYHSERFDKDIVRRLLGGLEAILEDMTAESGETRIRVLGDVGRDWDDGNLEYVELPLTNDGKVDRRALAASDQTRVEERNGYEAPRTKVEKKVAEIWQEVLGVERIGLHDSFFELGGHSLVVMRVASRIYKTFNVELSLHDFFKAPTVADLGMAIVLKHTESQDREKVMQALAGLE